MSSTAQKTTETNSYVHACFLCAFRGYRVQFRRCIPRVSLFGSILYYNVWVLAPACENFVA